MKIVNFVKGEIIDGSAVIVKKVKGMLNKGLYLEDEKRTIFPDCLWAAEFNDGYLSADFDDGFNYLDRKGNLFFPQHVDMTFDFSEGLAFYQNNDKTMLIDTTGRIIKEFDEGFYPNPFSNGVARLVFLEDRAETKIDKYIDREGNFLEVVTNKNKIMDFFDLEDFNTYYSDGLIRIKKRGRYGFVDRNNKTVIKCKYSDAGQFIDGLSAVLIGNKYGYIDKDDKAVLPFIYDMAFDFYNGAAVVNINNKFSIIDREGNFLLETDYDSLLDTRDGDFLFEINGKCGIINIKGEIIIPAEFDEIYAFNEGLARVTYKGNIGIIDRFGNIVIEEYNN